jgi:hypothetical protein
MKSLLKFLQYLLPVISILLTVLCVEGLALYLLNYPPSWLKSAPPAPPLLSASRFEIKETLSETPILSDGHRTEEQEPAKLEMNFVFANNDALWMAPPGEVTEGIYRNPITGESWTVHVTTDKEGRRIEPWHEARKHTAKKHIFGIGCSMTWGQGLDDDETLLAQVSKNSPEWITYNASQAAYGPSEIITQLKNTPVLENIEPKDGIGIYFLYDFHFQRMFNTLWEVGTWREHGLVLNEYEKGKFESIGRVADVYPLWTFLSHIVVKDPFLRLIHFDWPQISPSRLDTLFRVVNEMKLLYKEKTRAENPFIVALWSIDENRNLMREALTRAEIPFLDYSETSMSIHIKGPGHIGDGHPTAEVNEKFAIALNRDLKNYLQLK